MAIPLQAALGQVAKENTRQQDPVNNYLADLAKTGPKMYVYNIFNLEWTKCLGSLGSFTIPAVDTHDSDRPIDWEPYSRPLIIPHLIIETWDRGNNQSGQTPWPAALIVADILGTNQSRAGNDLRHYGVFVAEGEKPTKEELTKAKSLLVKRLTEDVGTGDNLWNGDAKSQAKVGLVHKRAARYLGVKKEWDAPMILQENCPFCGSSINPGAAKCLSCGEILDQAKFDLAKAKAAGQAKKQS